MMTVDQCKRAVAISDALDDLPVLRAAFAEDGLLFEIIALDGDRDGGSHRASAYIPAEFAFAIINIVERDLRSALRALGVSERPLTTGKGQP